MSEQCPPPRGTYPSDCELLEAYRTRARERGAEADEPKRRLAREKAKRVKLLLLDVDGVLTDGVLYYSSGGEECKGFHTQDGFGLRLLREAGIATGIITARESQIVARRARELRFDHIFQGVGNKAVALARILKDTGLRPVDVAYMGDDWLDLPVLDQVGLALAPANAEAEVHTRVHYVSSRTGGRGAVRDACMLILEARGLVPELLQKFARR